MITARLKGGLGNQMFQIGTALALSKKYKDSYGIDYNIKHHSGQGFPHLKYKDNIFKNIPIIDFHVPDFEVYNETRFNYAEIPKIKENLIIDGYFQTNKFFLDYKEDVRNMFHFDLSLKEAVDKKVRSIKNISQKNKVTVMHVRRGEYTLLPKIHPVQPLEFFEKAYNICNDNDTCFIIITDTPDWCRYNFTQKNVFFFQSGFNFFHDHKGGGLSELYDLYLASSADKNIISNSSFGWWGAYLGKQKEKVICPRHWFGEDVWFKPANWTDWGDIFVDGWTIL